MFLLAGGANVLVFACLSGAILLQLKSPHMGGIISSVARLLSWFAAVSKEQF